MSKTIETKTAETILQTPNVFEICGRRFDVAPPTTATLIQVSKLMSQLPTNLEKTDNYIYGSLMIAKDCEIIGLTVATLILGVKKHSNISEQKNKALNWLKIGKQKDQSQEFQYKELSDLILENYSPSQLDKLVVDLLTRMELKDFFDLTISLLEVNLLRKTKREMV